MLPDLNNLPVYDQTGVNERIERFCTRSIKTSSKTAGLKLALSMIDLTTLEGKDTEGKVRQLCYKAMHPHDSIKDLPTVAAICVYPSYVSTAKKALQGSDIKVASVSTAFPSGQSSLEAKLTETKFAVEQGADEIDMVISRGQFLAGNYQYVFDEISSVKKTFGGGHFKKKYKKKKKKKDFYLKTGKMIGMKPAGGISTAKIALQYLVMLNEVLGENWMNKNYFRFGASSLVNDLLMQLVKTETGMYQSPNYFSKD